VKRRSDDVSDDPYGDNLVASITRKKAARREAETVSAARADHICAADYTEREMEMIRALEQIATGRSSLGSQTDLAVCQNIAKEALRKAGWPAQ